MAATPRFTSDGHGNTGLKSGIGIRTAISATTGVCRKLVKSKTLISRWSVRWAWRYRVEERDRDKETVKAVALNTSIREMAERQADQAAVAVEGMMLPHLALAKAIKDSVEAKRAGGVGC